MCNWFIEKRNEKNSLNTNGINRDTPIQSIWNPEYPAECKVMICVCVCFGRGNILYD